MVKRKDIRAYRKILKPGRKVKLQVYDTPEQMTQIWTSGTVLWIGKYLAMVEYKAEVKNLAIRQMATRRETFRITDLYIWETT